MVQHRSRVMYVLEDSAQECVWVGVSNLYFYGSLLAFFPPISDLVQLCPCCVMNIMPLDPGYEQGLRPSLGSQVQEGFCSTLFSC